MQRTIVFNGLLEHVRRPGVTPLSSYISEISKIESAARPKIIVSSWHGEVNRYQELASLLSATDVTIVEGDAPNLILPGHMLHQVSSLDNALSQTEDNEFILKIRPDMYFEGLIRKFIDLNLEPVAYSYGKPSPFRHRVYVSHIAPAHFFFWADPSFAGAASDLRALTRLPMKYGISAQCMIAEQLLWSHLFLDAYPAIQAFFRVYPGVLHSAWIAPELIRAVIDLYKHSNLYCAALAAQIYIFQSSFKFFSSSSSAADQICKFTAEDLLWGDVDFEGISHSAEMSMNTINSSSITSAILNGNYASSEFGDRLNGEVRKLVNGDVGARSNWELEAELLSKKLDELGIPSKAGPAYEQSKTISHVENFRIMRNSKPLWTMKS